MHLRAEQIVFRGTEIYSAFEAFVNVVRTGEAGSTLCESFEPEDVGNIEKNRYSAYDFAQWKDRINVDKIEIMGHSFGGSTIVSFLCIYLALNCLIYTEYTISSVC
jgi:platelet-activating factor acetylhydrolase